MSLYDALVGVLGADRAQDILDRAHDAVIARIGRSRDTHDPVYTALYGDRFDAEVYWMLSREHPEALQDADVASYLGLCDICGTRVPHNEILANGGAWHYTCLRRLDEEDNPPDNSAEPTDPDQPEHVTLPLCRGCVERPVEAGQTVYTSTAEWGVCTVCRTHFLNEPVAGWLNVVATVEEEEPCDCGDVVRHNTGGNYHLTVWRIVAVLGVVGGC